tara:strand:+ start:244 stop:426 length:183 start_codon:yes stop_codon:yes gene_type:complete
MAKWTLEQKTDAAEIITLKSKNSKQRTEISRLTMALEKATKEKLSLLQDIKWMRGEKTGT